MRAVMGMSRASANNGEHRPLACRSRRPAANFGRRELPGRSYAFAKAPLFLANHAPVTAVAVGGPPTATGQQPVLPGVPLSFVTAGACGSRRLPLPVSFINAVSISITSAEHPDAAAECVDCVEQIFDGKLILADLYARADPAAPPRSSRAAVRRGCPGDHLPEKHSRAEDARCGGGLARGRCRSATLRHHLARLDDADSSADLGKLVQDVAGDEDRLAHRS